MRKAVRKTPRRAEKPTASLPWAFAPRAFTLIEVLLTVGIVTVMLGIVTIAFRQMRETNAMNLAVDTLTRFAGVARAYAMENDIETMLVVNPVNARLEIWHLNPPEGGGPWDPLSGGTDEPSINGYAYAHVFDSSVALPRGADGRPLVVVHPIDFDVVVPGDDFLRQRLPDDRQNRDNFRWPAVCFDPDGRLVLRMRRIATRVGTSADPLVDGYGNVANRRPDGQPDLHRAAPPYQVDGSDSRITSTWGFIVSDRQAFVTAVGGSDPSPPELFSNWLNTLRGPNGAFARRIVFGRVSARPVVEVLQ
jgi:prepilin-type N-terminal cleavage/methylation domain-containing protein